MYGEGIRSFYKGMTVNFLKAPLSLAISWTVKNNLNRLLDKAYDLWCIFMSDIKKNDTQLYIQATRQLISGDVDSDRLARFESTGISDTSNDA